MDKLTPEERKMVETIRGQVVGTDKDHLTLTMAERLAPNPAHPHIHHCEMTTWHSHPCKCVCGMYLERDGWVRLPKPMPDDAEIARIDGLYDTLRAHSAPKPPAERKRAYYRVKWPGAGWIPANYISPNKWLVCGRNDTLEDAFFSEIGPRIPMPDDPPLKPAEDFYKDDPPEHVHECAHTAHQFGVMHPDCRCACGAVWRDGKWVTA